MTELENFKKSINTHLLALHNLHLEELNKAKKNLEENPRAQWAKMAVERESSKMSVYKSILTNIKIGSYDDDTFSVSNLEKINLEFSK